jgi:glycosyltransferase involved in cell wall biosynthesis
MLHHHSYSYISRFDWRMKFIDWVIGESGCHVMSCTDMGVTFQGTYNSRRRWFTVPNTFMMPSVDISAGPDLREAGGVMTIGHLSNLCFEKGIDTVLDVFAELRRKALPVRLVLAGPPVSKKVATLVGRARDELGDAFVYRGAVHGDDKWAFFKEIDVFLFPTRYKIEAQPVVVFEALSFGRPVIAYGRGCIPGMIGKDGGHVIDVDDPFVSPAASLIEKWVHEPDVFQQQAQRASARGKTLRASAEPGLRRLVRALQQ